MCLQCSTEASPICTHPLHTSPLHIRQHWISCSLGSYLLIFGMHVGQGALVMMAVDCWWWVVNVLADLNLKSSLSKISQPCYKINQYYFCKWTKQLFDLCPFSLLRGWSSWCVTFCWLWGPVCGSGEAAVTESLARPLDHSWLVSRGTSARSESSHSATDRLNTRYIPDWTSQLLCVKKSPKENSH